MKKIIPIFIFTSMIISNLSCDNPKENNDIDKKVEKLLSEMTLDEKIGQLNQYTSSWEMTGPVPEFKDAQSDYDRIKKGLVGSMLNVTGAEATRKAQELAVKNSRLGIPLMFGYDVVHGYKTMFPIPLAIASSWDAEASTLASKIAAKEATAAGLNWAFGPVLDITREARWGRIMEGAGEDPYLGSVMAVAQVKGLQGNDLGDIHTLAACAKHYAAYGFVEAGRDYNTVEITEHTLRNVVLPPFKAAVDAGLKTVMTSFSVIGGIPSTSNTHLLRDILKDEWKFEGFVLSDWNSIGEIYNHGVAANKKEAAELAIKAGTDVDMEGDCYFNHLKDLVNEGKVSESLIDDAVKRILKIKYELGLFEDPYKYSDKEREKIFFSEEHLIASREVARKSIVLLKNENNLLPLKKEGQTIAVIGELANDKDTPLGSWRAKTIPGSAVSLLEGIKALAKENNSIFYEKGPDFILNEPQFLHELEINEDDLRGIDKAVALAKKVDVVVLAIGENCFQSGEGRSQTNIELKGVQQELFDAIYKVNKNIVVVLMNGRPIAIEKVANNAKAILETWYLGSQAGNAIADVLFGDYNPSGKLPVSFPRNVGQCPIYYNHFITGRPFDKDDNVFWSHYTDQSSEPLFPFGFGLSYTTFEYENLNLNKKEISKSESLEVSINVKNTGKVEGKETVQLYVRDLYGSISRPVKELKAFEQVVLKPGETKTITFTLTIENLKYFTGNGIWDVEPGEFRLWVGTSSEEGLEDGFVLN